MSNSQEEIFTEIWHKYHSQMLLFCYANLKGCNEDAEEILSHAFALLWEKMITTDSAPPTPQAWLYRTISYLMRNEYRRQKKDRGYLVSGSDTYASLLYAADFDEQIIKQEPM